MQPQPLARWKLGSKIAETRAELLEGCDEDTATALLELMRAGLKLTGWRVAEGSDESMRTAAARRCRPAVQHPGWL